MLKFNNNDRTFFNDFRRFKNIIMFIQPLKSYKKIIILKNIFNFGTISKKNNNMVLSLPLNRQKTRSRKPKYHNVKTQIITYLFLLKYFKLPRMKFSRNFLVFDYINRLWFKQWADEWWLIRKKRLFVKKITYRGRINVNFPILKYKHVIRNLKSVNKKKTKFLKHFNLGFFFYEYTIEAKTINRFNKRILKRKFSKYFVYKTIKKLMLKSKSLNTQKLINLVISLLVLILVALNLIGLFIIIGNRYNFTHILIVLILIYILNIISYFFSIYQNSKYTSAIKFFWVRVFNIIWFLEFYLFIVCIFIYIISPAELKVYVDASHQVKPNLPNINSNLNYTLILLSVIALNILSVSNQYNNSFKKNLTLLIITLMSTYVFVCEMKVYYYYAATTLYSDIKLFINKNNNNFNDILTVNNDVVSINVFNKKINTEKKYLQPYVFILNLILCVKFVHVFLIVFINFIFILISLNKSNKILLEVIGMWQQNLIILLIFWALNYTIFFKFMFKFICYGFYSNIYVNNLINQQQTMVDELYLI